MKYLRLLITRYTKQKNAFLNQRKAFFLEVSVLSGP